MSRGVKSEIYGFLVQCYIFLLEGSVHQYIFCIVMTIVSRFYAKRWQSSPTSSICVKCHVPRTFNGFRVIIHLLSVM